MTVKFNSTSQYSMLELACPLCNKEVLSQRTENLFCCSPPQYSTAVLKVFICALSATVQCEHFVSMNIFSAPLQYEQLLSHITVWTVCRPPLCQSTL